MSFMIAPPSTALIAALLPSALPPPPPRRTRIAHPPPPLAHPGCLECGLPWGIPCIVLVAPPTHDTPIDCSEMDIGMLDVWPFDNRPGRKDEDEDEDEASPPHRYTLPPVPGTVLPIACRAPAPPLPPSHPSSVPSLDVDLSELDDFLSWTESAMAELLRPVRHTRVSRSETWARREAGQRSRVERRVRQASKFEPLPVVEEVEEADGREDVETKSVVPLRRAPRTARRTQRSPLADRTNTVPPPPSARRGIRTAIKTAKVMRAELKAKGKV